MLKKETIKRWFLEEGLQSYGFILIGMAVAGGFGEPEMIMAALQACTSTDFIATSFGFLFAAMFVGARGRSDGIPIVWGLICCAVFYTVMKIFPLNIPARFSAFNEIQPKVRILWYSLFSLASVVYTLAVISSIKNGDSNASS
ncbi:hypothetical protein [Acidovorax sp. PRC11]|uniref:hypothetical protein n=1 Tax=Acidovorax sp. PRC11 TaxID=2962592 RepID=UPI0028810108|nr:hypothetical protein [Acidovorax sp. PRC11]MDT0137269.1 hypothetical protein [Acidovorax sp. PRC11]